MFHDDPFTLYKPILIITKLSCIQFPCEDRRNYIIISSFLFMLVTLATLKARETISTIHFLPDQIRIEQCDIFMLYASLVTVLHTFVFYYRNGETIMMFFSKLRCFDDGVIGQLKFEFATRKCERKTVPLVVALFVATMTVYLARIWIYYSIFKSLQWHTIVYFYVYYLQFNMMLHYVFFLSQLLFRFACLNEYLSKLRDNNHILTKQRLRLVKILHEHLLSLGRSIGEVFGIYQAHLVIYSCLDQLLSSFFIFLAVKDRMDQRSSIFGADVIDLLINLALQTCLQLFLLFSFADEVEIEVNKLKNVKIKFP